MAGAPHPADQTHQGDEPPSRFWPRWAIAAVLAAVVLWQAFSCYRLYGATAPPVTPFPVSKDLAAEMRERVMQAKSTKGPFAIAFSDQELTSYIVSRLQSGPGEFPARDMQIQFGDGLAEIWITFIDIAPSDIPVYVQATVEAVQGHAVFHITQASAASITIPGAMRELISQVLSETLAELELGLLIERAEVEAGRLVLEGQVTGDVPDLP